MHKEKLKKKKKQNRNFLNLDKLIYFEFFVNFSFDLKTKFDLQMKNIFLLFLPVNLHRYNTNQSIN